MKCFWPGIVHLQSSVNWDHVFAYISCTGHCCYLLPSLQEVEYTLDGSPACLSDDTERHTTIPSLILTVAGSWSTWRDPHRDGKNMQTPRTRLKKNCKPEGLRKTTVVDKFWIFCFLNEVFANKHVEVTKKAFQGED